jgi:hypothetical protein
MLHTESFDVGDELTITLFMDHIMTDWARVHALTSLYACWISRARWCAVQMN